MSEPRKLIEVYVVPGHNNGLAWEAARDRLSALLLESEATEPFILTISVTPSAGAERTEATT